MLCACIHTYGLDVGRRHKLSDIKDEFLRLHISVNNSLEPRTQWYQGRVLATMGRSYPDFFPASRLRFGWVTSHLSLFSVTNNVTRHICHISGKNVTLLHIKIFFWACDDFCHMLPETRHILAPPVQKNFEREEMWRYGWDWNTFSSSCLRFATYLGSVKREGHLG